MLNLPQQSSVWRAAGLKTASLVPLQRGTTGTAPGRHTPPGDLEPPSLCCEACSGLCSPGRTEILISHWQQSSMLTSSAGMMGASSPSSLTCTCMGWSAWPAPRQQKDCCTYAGGVRARSLHCQSIWAVAGQTPSAKTFGRWWRKEGFHILHDETQIWPVYLVLEDSFFKDSILAIPAFTKTRKCWFQGFQYAFLEKLHNPYSLSFFLFQAHKWIKPVLHYCI